MIIASGRDFRGGARRRLPRFLFDYADGGAYDEVTLAQNQADLRALNLRQRVLVGDLDAIDLRTTLFGRALSAPIVLGPVGLAGMYRRRGEVQVKRAADAAGIPFCLSTVSVCPLQEIARPGAPDLWFQLYVMRDRAFMGELISEARRNGVRTLTFTVDMPTPGARYRDAHSGLSGRFGSARRLAQAIAHPQWALDVGLGGQPHSLGNIAPALGGKAGLSDFMGWMAANFDPTIGWKDLEAIRALWDGPLILKGILDVDDARRAADLGVDGLVVSNHGGRQLDGAISTARALPAIAQAVGERLTVMADGGVRSGLDIVRMLALGAKAVWLGRLWIFALACGGEAGVTQLLEILRREMIVAMTLTGCRDLGAIDEGILVRER